MPDKGLFLFPAVGLVFLANAVYGAAKLSKLLNEGSRAEGEIIGMHKQPSGKGMIIYPVVVFSDSLGRKVEFRGYIGLSSAVGQKVNVIYRPDRPAESAMIDYGLFNWLGVVLGCALGACFIYVSQ